MALKRICAFFVSAFILLSAIAFTAPYGAIANSASQSEQSLPISLASPAGNRMYFLPSRNEVLSADPIKKGFVLPSVTLVCDVQTLAFFSEVLTVSDLTGKSCFKECITPRAP